MDKVSGIYVITNNVKITPAIIVNILFDDSSIFLSPSNKL